MKHTATMDEAFGPEAAEAAEVFAQSISKIDRLLKEMRAEQEAIRTTGERTDATLSEIAGILAQLKAA